MKIEFKAKNTFSKLTFNGQGVDIYINSSNVGCANLTGAAFFNSSRNKSESRALAHTSTLYWFIKNPVKFC